MCLVSTNTNTGIIKISGRLSEGFLNVLKWKQNVYIKRKVIFFRYHVIFTLAFPFHNKSKNTLLLLHFLIYTKNLVIDLRILKVDKL